MHCPFFHRKKNMDSSTDGLMISLASVCYGDSQVAKLFSTPGLPTNLGGGAILALYSFLNQIPHQKEPEISVGMFSPT